MSVVALRYLERFACIGAACEDDCCTGWDIPVDEAHYRALVERLSESGEEVSRTVRVVDAPQPGRHALMVLGADLRCAMLDEDRLCRIHKRFGEPLLPDTCAVYPRSVGRVADRRELAGALSCPEVARLCLLVDGATDAVAAAPERVVRGLVYKDAGVPDEPYVAAFDVVRMALHRMLGRRTFPVASRLFFLSVFAHQTARYFYRGAQDFDAELFDGELARLGRDAELAPLDHRFRAFAVEDPFAVTVVTQVLEANRAGAPPAFLRLVDAVLRGYGYDAGDPGWLWAAHRQRAAALGGAGALVELAVENFARNYVFKDWYLKSPSFAVWALGLVVRVACLRFLVVGHPAVAADPARAVVEAAYTLARTLEHDERPMTRILDALAAQGMTTPAHSVALLKL
jgi:lysine-N-methylase